VSDVQVWLAKEITWHGPFVLRLAGDLTCFPALQPSHWVIVVGTGGTLERVGRILRIRADLDWAMLYFDRLHRVKSRITLGDIGLTLATDLVGRVCPEDLVRVLSLDGVPSAADVPLIQDVAHVRTLLELATRDDLRGPANGPEELVIDMSVRDRYLVGKLGPQKPSHTKSSFAVEPAAAFDEEDDSVEENDAPRHEPGAEFHRASGRVEPEDDAMDDIDTTNNQSLVPSSMGITFFAGTDVQALNVTARWGSPNWKACSGPLSMTTPHGSTSSVGELAGRSRGTTHRRGKRSTGVGPRLSVCATDWR